MSQQQQQQRYSRPKLEQGARKLNKDVAPIKRVTKNDSMKMKSKAFKASRRMSNAPTNMSKKAVSKKTSGMKGSGKSIGKKSYSAKTATYSAPQQTAQPGQRALYRSATMQPQKAHVRAKKGPALPKTYASSQKAVRKAMGYSS